MMRRLLERAVRIVRHCAYRLGFRPRFGSILYSPSAAWIYGYRDADLAAQLKRIMDGGRL